jgi:UDPglucose--hexose-1-phosphate uridylyltransferase
MPELRQNAATKEWVIIATERSRRPHDFRGPERAPSEESPHSPSCPFCPGNESMTPPEVFRLPDGNGAWNVRVVPNRFAALVPEGSLQRKEQSFFRSMDAVGRHEVVIETPYHNQPIALADTRQVESALQGLRARYLALREDSRLRSILIFKNHGVAAGTSLEHPHFQIAATPIVPHQLRMWFREAAQYWDDTGRCVHCDMCDEELKDGRRIILQSPHFVVFHPFASRSPFETWLFPRRHSACYGHINDAELADLAVVLKSVLGKLYTALNNPAFNMILHTAPVPDEAEDYYLWHIQIILRLTNPAGFEMGSGMYINTALPEETAAFIREHP